MRTFKLSAAQKRALAGIPVRRSFIPAHTGFQWATLARLKALRMINGVKDGLAGCGPEAEHVITPRGLRFREQIKAEFAEAAE
jgi:hypothetical protein